MIKIWRTWEAAKSEIEAVLCRPLLAGLGSQEVLVKQIIDDVRQRGDEAVLEYIHKFDCPAMTLEELKINAEEIKLAYNQVDEEFLKAFSIARGNIEKFHKRELGDSWIDSSEAGIVLGKRYQPIERVGMYVPGGLAAYPSTVLMVAIPAKLAEVPQIITCSPPDKNGRLNPYTLVAANEVGITEIFKIGGAQAIAAMAFGTETVPKVDKIVGPGNIYVTLAKKLVFGWVGIDGLYGPSEIVVLADEAANPEFIAADLISQAEHDERAVAILLTDSEAIANKVKDEIEKQVKGLKKPEVVLQAFENGGAIVVTCDIEEAIQLINLCAPEHLELMVRNPDSILDKIKHAGMVFLGPYSPVALGDYLAGPSHVLPTGGTARFSSGLSVADFLKKSNIVSYSKQKLSKVKDEITKLAEVEGLDGHAKAVKKRFAK